MDHKEQELRNEIQRLIREKLQEDNQLDEAGLTGWIIDKVANGMKWATNRKADYQFDFLLKHKDFRGLAKKFKMTDKNWERTAKGWLAKDPKGFAKVLKNQISSSSLNNIFKKHGLR
jgi:hypothetical protein|tara:strand:+ start:84 stop:434 length:351 start_codon:yes stop_codon:yes gene_type:complete